MAVARLKKRPQFLRVAARGRKWATPGLVLQACERRDEAASAPRVGFTASRKVGGAVSRNRARRRLRAAAEKVLPVAAAPEFDYVLIARRATVERPFGDLVADLEGALKRLGLYRAGAKATNGDREESES
jgi:ribonuclease P protein component